MDDTSIRKGRWACVESRAHRLGRTRTWGSLRRCCRGLALGAAFAAAALPSRAADSPFLPASAQTAAAALQRAGAALRRGDRDEALRSFHNLHEAEPNLRDLIAWFEAALWLEREEDELARAAVERGLISDPQKHMWVRLERLRGDLARRAGDEEAARAAWQRALRGAGKQKAELRLALARSFERHGAPQRAGEQYLKLWLETPTEAAAEQAEERLGALESEGAVPARSPGDWLRRADSLFAERRSEAALAAYQRVANDYPAAGEEERERAAFGAGRCQFRLRRYAEAVTAFASLPDGSRADFWEARSLARSGRVENAIEAFLRLADTAHGELALRARYLAALLHHGRGRHAPARAHFEAILRAPDENGALTRAALWQLAWADYRTGNYDAARRRFVDLSGRFGNPLEALRPRYWAARALEETSAETAERELLAIANEYPLSYYGWQAARRLRAPPVKPTPNPLRDTGSSLSTEQLRRPQVLIAAELADLARAELIALRGAARHPRDRIAVAALQAHLGEHHDAFRTVVIPYKRILARGVGRGLEELWRLAWPRPWPRLVGELPASGHDPAVLWSVMREESGYRPRVISITGARGLLQIMPETGAQLARHAGLAAYGDNLLMLPRVNVQLGALYLRRLSARFEGDLAAAVASYNAGPRAVGSWRTEEVVEDDVWIESIPYQQTRNYVKRVLRSVAVYRRLYPDDASLNPAAATRGKSVGGVPR